MILTTKEYSVIDEEACEGTGTQTKLN